LDEIIAENVDISTPEDEIVLKGSIYYTQKTPTKAPFIINLAGLLDHRESYFVKFFSEKFANAGYYVLSYDYRAHGETKKQTGSRWDKMVVRIFLDINDVITWTISEQSNRLLLDKIALFGRSLGGAIILTHGFLDKRVKKLIALCTRYDYITTKIRFPDSIIRNVSPKYYLKELPENNERIMVAHCEDDPRIPFENIYHIKQALNLDDKNVFTYSTGGHSFKGHRDDIFEHSIKFLKTL